MRPTLQLRDKLLARWRKTKRRKGTILVLAASLMIVMLAMLALSIDTGYMFTMQTQLDRSVDAAALAGAGALIEGTEAANESVIEYLVRNPVAQPTPIVTDDELVQLTAEFIAERSDDFEIEWGNWNLETEQFEPTSSLPSAISVSMSYPNLPLFFGRALGKESFSVHSHATAMYQPRDIMVVLDFSGSMNDDSELGAISTLGQESVEANIHQMWEELGSPTYGNLQYEPDWVTIPFVNIPARVTWRTSQVDIAAETSMQYVWLEYYDGYSQYFSTSATSGVWEGTGSHGGKRITRCAAKINGTWEVIDFYSNDDVRRGLALDSVDYPYPSGSWSDYIEYARSHGSSMPWYDRSVYDAGYRRKFGMLTLINFWNKNKPAHNQTPDLWKVSAQPVTAVKDALDVFVDYVTLVDTNDRVGLSIYNAPNGEGLLEVGLTSNFDEVVDTARHRQASHYHNYTNIGAGMKVAREELEQNGRVGAFKMIVLMTDGQANWYNGSYSTSSAHQYVITQAEQAAALNYPVVALSLGAGADTGLMQDVADITESRHFNIPGGQSVSEYRTGLIQVFREIADSRPLKLVQ